MRSCFDCVPNEFFPLSTIMWLLQVVSDASIGVKRLQSVHFRVAMSGVELRMWLLLKLGARGSMLCRRVDWEQALEHHDITAEVRSTTSGQLLKKGLMAKVTTYSV